MLCEAIGGQRANYDTGRTDIVTPRVHFAPKKTYIICPNKFDMAPNILGEAKLLGHPFQQNVNETHTNNSLLF